MDRLSGYMSVSEAARLLKVSPGHVRDLVSEGRLHAAKLDRELLVRATDVHHRFTVVRPKLGSPLAPRIAWAMLVAASGDRPTWVSSAEMVRVRKHARRPLSEWPRLLTRRAERYSARMLPGALKKLSSLSETAVGGTEAAVSHGGNLVAPADAVTELYVSRPVFQDARHARGIDWESGTPNVILRVLPELPGSAVAAIVGGRYVPLAAAAADLLDDGDERAVRTAADLLERVHPKT